MRLQLRVRHALGTRMLEVEGRGAENPLVVGRDAAADVQVPVGTVSGRHCLLWVQDGQWCVQDAGSRLGTLVNGQSIGTEGVVLAYGDVLTLGQGPAAPTIQLDPQGLARRATMPVSAAARPPQPGPDDQAPLASWSDQTPAPPVPGPELAEEDAAYADLASATAGPARRSYRRPRAKPSSAHLLPLTLFIVVAMLLVGGIIIASVGRKEPTPVMQPKPEPPKEQPKRRELRKGNIFEEGRGEEAHINPVAVATKPPPVDAVYQRRRGNQESAATHPAAAEKGSDEYKALEAVGLSGGAHPGQALWTLFDFQQKNAGKYEADLKEFIEIQMDRLWWKRVIELWDKRVAFDAEIGRLETEIGASNDEAFRNERQGEKAKLTFLRGGVEELLAQDMGYAENERPNETDEDQLNRLRGRRSADKYAAWQARVKKTLIERRKLPWGSW